jgi:hypothetical protein
MSEQPFSQRPERAAAKGLMGSKDAVRFPGVARLVSLYMRLMAVKKIGAWALGHGSRTGAVKIIIL